MVQRYFIASFSYVQFFCLFYMTIFFSLGEGQKNEAEPPSNGDLLHCRGGGAAILPSKCNKK